MREGEREDEDAAWQSIVDNYGERASIDDVPTAAASTEPDDAPERLEPLPDHLVDEPEWSPILDAPPERYVPPPPPPLPRPQGARGLAWVTLLAVPVIFVACALASYSLPALLATLLGLSALAAFGYLVWSMPQERPDPWDDGSRV